MCGKKSLKWSVYARERRRGEQTEGNKERKAGDRLSTRKTINEQQHTQVTRQRKAMNKKSKTKKGGDKMLQ